MGLRLPKTKGMIRREAAAWLARLQSGREDDIEVKFRRWRETDPRHAAAFDRVRRSYEQAGLLRHSTKFAGWGHAPAVGKPRWQPRPALAAAAAILILVPVGALLIREGMLPFGGPKGTMLMTAVGEIRQVNLADGSRVTLDTATKVELQIGQSRRAAHLRYGRARFQVAPAKVPFTVQTDSATITADHGIVDVEQVGQEGHVRVLAGAVDVRGSGEDQTWKVALAPGQGLTANSVGAKRSEFGAAGPDWTRGMLQFDQTPLAKAVELANRYSERHIILAGDLGAIRVTGAFRAGDTPRLAKALAEAFGLSLEQRPDGNLLLSPNASRGLEKKRGG